MMEARPTTSFPVVFFDGEIDLDIGDVAIHPSIEFKKLQSILSQKIGISPHQITLSIVCRKKSRSTGTRKIPINEKVNFSTILQQEKDCFFLVSLKPSSSRRGRKGGRARQFHEEEDDVYFTSSPQIDSLHQRFLIDPPQKVLLRRDSTANPAYYNNSGNQGLRLGFRDYEQLQIEKENYLMSINSFPYAEIEDSYEYGYGYGSGGGGERISKNTAVCEVCSSANGRPIPFHWCVYDPTTVGFRSPAGPIARPSKG